MGEKSRNSHWESGETQSRSEHGVRAAGRGGGRGAEPGDPQTRHLGQPFPLPLTHQREDGLPDELRARTVSG